MQWREQVKTEKKAARRAAVAAAEATATNRAAPARVRWKSFLIAFAT